jgi:phospholipid/cholesterol/gamma-HCH transport system substrate-binding protein
MKQNLMETAVGALVIAIALGFFIFMYSTTGVGKGSGGYHLTAKFKNVEGINVGSDVRMSGIKIGSVTSQTLDNKSYDAVLTFAIDPAIKLPDDSTAKITSEGLLGGKFIALEPGGSETLLSDGGTITYTQGALDLWALVSDLHVLGQASADLQSPHRAWQCLTYRPVRRTKQATPFCCKAAHLASASLRLTAPK